MSNSYPPQSWADGDRIHELEQQLAVVMAERDVWESRARQMLGAGETLSEGVDCADKVIAELQTELQTDRDRLRQQLAEEQKKSIDLALELAWYKTQKVRDEAKANESTPQGVMEFRMRSGDEPSRDV